MHLSDLHINQFRNISQLKLQLHPGFNGIYGENGSGKTSLLEAIYFLGLGRSFRTHHTRRVIQQPCDKFTLFSTLQREQQSLSIGLEKTLDGQSRIKVGGSVLKSMAELVDLMPLQLIHPDSYQLLHSGPKYRRQFLDWGVFHVEHVFFPAWQRYKRILRQRNAALKKQNKKEITLWDDAFIEQGNILNTCRQSYLADFIPCFEHVLTQVLPEMSIDIHYQQGWNQSFTLAEALSNSFERDLQLQATQVGAHRANLKFIYEGFPAQDILSRGQQKLLITAALLAQGLLLFQRQQKACIYLIDDLTAELDETRQALVGQLLMTMNAQVFVTSVSSTELSTLVADNPHKMFHVEHGVIIDSVA